MPDFTTLDDLTLVEHASRNPEAFTALYRRNLTPLYRYLYRRLNNAHDAEDLTTQVLIDVLKGLAANRYREGGCFVAWLFTIARRRTVFRIDYWRALFCCGRLLPCFTRSGNALRGTWHDSRTGRSINS